MIYRLSSRAEADLAEIWVYSQQSHVIYFRAHGDARQLIEIVRVLHGRMEPHRYI